MGENAAPVDFGDIPQYRIRIFIDFYPLFNQKTEDHVSIHKPLALYQKTESRLLNEKKRGNVEMRV